MTKFERITLMLLGGIVLCLAQTTGDSAAPSKVVTGVPFTANATTLRTQTLPEGGHIMRTTNSILARDGVGRTRLEQIVDPNRTSRKLVFITDAVQQVNYVLESNHRARRILWATGTLSSSSIEAKEPTAADVKVESLGTQVIEGFQTQGTLTTETIPAGTSGNDTPIQITYERWYSPELRLDLQTRREDPRSGETLYQVTQIKRIEPPASMFEVPADYKVQDVTP